MRISHLYSKYLLFGLIWGIVLGLPISTGWAATSAKTLKIAMLPIIDAFPYYVAEADGDFEAAGIEVKLVPVVSGLNRDQLMQAGEVDGMLNELTTVANFNRKRVQVKVLCTIRSARPDAPMFRLVAAPGSGLQSVSDLAGVSVGISKNTIIEYMTDRVLQANQVAPDRIVKKSIPPIPERFQLLMQGQIDAAVLPDPLAFAALKAGAGLIVDDSDYPSYSVSLLTFSMESIERKPEIIKRFLWAWDQAVARLNRSPESYRELLLAKVPVPPNVRQSYAIPRFSRNSVPDEAQWTDVMRWMVEKGLLRSPLPYADSVTDRFLPGTQ